MIATYIQELLATNNRVIVPNYGAFLVRATSKSKDANTLKEKLKDIYFSPFLKFNDELLEKYIIKKENVSKEQAAQNITTFIDEVKKVLEQEKPFMIPDFGEFIADKQGKVQFNPYIKEETEASSKTESKAASKKPTKKTVKEPIKTEEKSKTEEKPKAAETIKESSVSEKEAKKEIVLEEFKEEKKEEKKEPLSASKTEPKKTPVSAPVESIYASKKEKKSINKGLIWSIALGLPAAAIFVWVLLNFTTVKKVLNRDKAKTEKVAQKKKTTIAKKQAAKKETATKTESPKQPTQEAETKVQKPDPAPPQKKYYIIAGSFKNEKYAVSYLNKLKAEGYNAEKLAERNGMHAVSFNSFTDKNKAMAEYKFLAQEKGLQTWILYY